MLSYAWRDLLHNPRRTFASLVGVILGIGLFSGVLFFMDGSGATLTRRAIASLPIDLQRVLTSPTGGGLRLTERISAPAPFGTQQEARVVLTVANTGAAPANEVVVSDAPPSPLTYVNGTTTIDGKPVRDVGGESPLAHGLAGFGMNIGSVEPGATVRISYAVRAQQAVDDAASLPLRGSVSSREQAEPVSANAPTVPTPEALRAKVETIPGVAAADVLGFADLPPGSLSDGGTTIRRPVRVFSFDARYRARYRSIRLVAGGFRPGSALLSAEAAGALAAEAGAKVGPGATVELTIPGRATRLALPVSGVVDLARAQPLFSSRKATKLEEFLYVPDAIVVTPAVFRDEVLPAFAKAQASLGSQIKSFPVLELDVMLERSGLEADPATAYEQSKRVAALIDRIGPERDYLIDNISSRLAVASDDAAAGKRMFLFLGLPGLLMAAFLAAYAGGILAAAQRREHAILRVRGAHRAHLGRIAAYRALLIAGAGSIVGITTGLASATTALGWATLSQAQMADLAVSALISVATGGVITALALFIPAQRSVRREVGEERREVHRTAVPAWRRLRLDLALLAAAGVAEIVAIRTGALDPPSGSVYAGVAISLPTRLLLTPLMAWVGGSLLFVRLPLAIASHLPAPASRSFGGVIGGIVRRSLRRRPWGLAGGVIGLGLVVAFGASLMIFSSTYRAAKLADSRFSVGADLRITPSVLSARQHGPAYASELAVAGVSAVSPVVFGLENSVLIGPHNQRATNLAAVDPPTFARVAPLPDSFFLDRPAAEVWSAFEADRQAALVDAETADDLQVETGDAVEIILALGTKREATERFRVAGVFTRFAGTPEGANLVVNLDRYEEATGGTTIDFFLADVGDGPADLPSAIAALRAGPGASDPIHIDSAQTALVVDQSSLTALNVNGLIALDALYVFVLSAAIIAIFVFGLMLQRRREYVTLRAQGVRTWELHVLVFAEASFVAVCGLVAGIIVGAGTGFLLVQILRALFILDPVVAFPLGRIAGLAALVAVATVVSGAAATEILRRLKPAEILREE